MKTENLSIGLRVLYHSIEWLTVFLILLIFAVQIITPLYAGGAVTQAITGPLLRSSFLAILGGCANALEQ